MNYLLSDLLRANNVECKYDDHGSGRHKNQNNNEHFVRWNISNNWNLIVKTIKYAQCNARNAQSGEQLPEFIRHKAAPVAS